MIKCSANNHITRNYLNTSLVMLIPAVVLLGSLVFYFYTLPVAANNIERYWLMQKDWFFYFNSFGIQYPLLSENITQIGDVSVGFAFVSIFLYYTPKLWEVLLTSSVLSLGVSAGLKKIFAMPRPAAMLENNSFNILGKTLTGSNSLPSGHSITIMVIFCTILFGFMPKKPSYRVLWFALILFIGFSICFSRVAVGAHYPLDVICGGTLGYMITVVGITINNRWNWLGWLKNPTFYWFHIVVLVVWLVLLLYQFYTTLLFIYGLAIGCLVFTLFIFLNNYVKKIKTH